MEAVIPNDVIARELVASLSHKAPQHVLDLAFAAIKRGATNDEIEHFADLMRRVERVGAVQKAASD